MAKKEIPAIRNALAESFAETFQLALVRKYKKVPTAQFISVQFNARCEPDRDITQESVRRWLNGITMPEFDRLIIIKDWLGIDLNGFGKPESEYPAPSNTELLPVDPYVDRLKYRELNDLEELSNILQNTIENHIRSRRLR